MQTHTQKTFFGVLVSENPAVRHRRYPDALGYIRLEDCDPANWSDAHDQ